MKTLSPDRQIRTCWPFHLVLLLFLIVMSACSGQRFEAIPPGARVLVIGDSITAGYGFSPERAWTSHMATGSGWQIINAGVSGDTTTGGLARLPELLEEHRPAAVIIELGGNDMLRRQPSAAIGARIEAMIALIQEHKSRPVLMAIPRPSVAGVVLSSLSDAPFYSEIARQKNIPLIEEVISSTLSRSEFKLDDIHPNLEGHRRIGLESVKSLRKQGLIRP